MSNKQMKMNYPQRTIHLDFHTMPGVKDVGMDFNGREFAKTLREAHVDSINVFAKCNLGFAYYPTRVGIPHPGLQCDLLGEMVKACHNEGILVAAYFNAGLDHENALRHRDWCVLPEDGTIYRDDKLNPFFRRMCLNTAYGDYLLAMTEEVLKLYPIDGLFFDCFNPLVPCYGIECRKLMDDNSSRDSAFAVLNRINLEFAQKVMELASDKKLLYFNCIPFRDQAPYCRHFEIECLPQSEWGYDNFPANVRYTRNLGRYTIGQTGRFQGGWGDFGGIRTAESLRFDCYHAISNAVTCGVGDHMHPRGKLDREVYQLIGNIFADLKTLEPWTAEARAVTEIAVLIPQDAMGYPITNLGEANHPVAAAVRMLSELKYQVNVIDWDMDFSAYKVLIMPDRVFVPDKHRGKLEEYIASGGGVISSGYSGLSEDKSDFALPDEWGIAYEGQEKFNVSFFEVEPDFAENIPRTQISIYDPGISAAVKAGTEIAACLWEPYFNKHWDGYHGYYYVPPKQATNRPVLTRKGNVFHCVFPIFKSYYEHAYVVYRSMIDNCIKKMLPEPLIKAKNLPSFARITVTEQDKRTMIHILAYVTELRGKKQIIEEPVTLTNVEIALRADSTCFKNVYTAPNMEKIIYSVSDGYVSVNIPEILGYSLIVMENSTPCPK
jgi:hypothetical protein